jgi:hypothetical protein
MCLNFWGLIIYTLSTVEESQILIRESSMRKYHTNWLVNTEFKYFTDLIKMNCFFLCLQYIFNSKEWVSDCCLTPLRIFQLYHGENKLIFNEMMMRSASY